MPKSIPTLGDSNWGTPLNNHLSQLQNPNTGGINSFEQFSGRPTNLIADAAGRTYLYTQTGNLHHWTGTAWKVLNESVINVKDYGAVGDGVADDSVAIQLSFASAGNLTSKITKSIEIYFPSGVYITTSQIIIDSTLGYRPMTVRGSGNGSAGINAQNCNLFKITGSTITIRDLSFSTSAKNIFTAFELINCGWNIYENLFFGAGWKTCFKCIGLLNSRFDKITAVGETGTLPTGGVFSVDYSVNNTVSNSYFSNYSKVFYFSLVTSPAGNLSEGWNMSNVISVICDYFVYAEKILLLSIVGCTLDFNGSSAVLVKSGGSIKIADNWIAGQGDSYAGFNFPDTMKLIDINNMSGAWDSTICGNTFYIDFRLYPLSQAIDLNNPQTPPYVNISNPSLNTPAQNPSAFITNNNFVCANAGSVIGKSVICGNSYTGKNLYDLGQSSTEVISSLNLLSHYTCRFLFEKKNLDDTTKHIWNLETGNSNDSFRITDLSNSKDKIVIGENSKPICFLNGGVVIGTERLSKSPLSIDSVPEYSDNSSAIAAGLSIGDVYRSGELLKIVF